MNTIINPSQLTIYQKVVRTSKRLCGFKNQPLMWFGMTRNCWNSQDPFEGNQNSVGMCNLPGTSKLQLNQRNW